MKQGEVNLTLIAPRMPNGTTRPTALKKNCNFFNRANIALSISCEH